MYKSYEQLGSQQDPGRDILDVVEIANSQHKKQLLSTHHIVCVDIYADWCGPCKQTAASYSLVAKNYSKSGYCAVVKYNLEKMEPLEKANIHGIPVFQFYVDGTQVDEVVGADIPLVEEKLKKLLQGGNQTVNNIEGPSFNRSSIRNVRSQIPNMDSREQPYQPSSGNYHQPYQNSYR